jgi:hypothetical protein
MTGEIDERDVYINMGEGVTLREAFSSLYQFQKQRKMKLRKTNMQFKEETLTSLKYLLEDGINECYVDIYKQEFIDESPHTAIHSTSRTSTT